MKCGAGLKNTGRRKGAPRGSGSRELNGYKTGRVVERVAEKGFSVCNVCSVGEWCGDRFT